MIRIVEIGDDVIVTVLGVHGNQIRIGVATSQSIAVHREEVINEIAEKPR